MFMMRRFFHVYAVAVHKGMDVDLPRHLAPSVTVEHPSFDVLNAFGDVTGCFIARNVVRLILQV